MIEVVIKHRLIGEHRYMFKNITFEEIKENLTQHVFTKCEYSLKRPVIRIYRDGQLIDYFVVFVNPKCLKEYMDTLHRELEG